MGRRGSLGGHPLDRDVICRAHGPCWRHGVMTITNPVPLRIPASPSMKEWRREGSFAYPTVLLITFPYGTCYVFRYTTWSHVHSVSPIIQILCQSYNSSSLPRLSTSHRNCDVASEVLSNHRVYWFSAGTNNRSLKAASYTVPILCTRAEKADLCKLAGVNTLTCLVPGELLTIAISMSSAWDYLTTPWTKLWVYHQSFLWKSGFPWLKEYWGKEYRGLSLPPLSLLVLLYLYLGSTLWTHSLCSLAGCIALQCEESFHVLTRGKPTRRLLFEEIA